MINIRLEIDGSKRIATEEKIEEFSSKALEAKKNLLSRNGLGNDFLGWVDLPEEIGSELLESIRQDVARLAPKSELFVVIGIGINAIRQENINQLILRVTPENGTGKTLMSKSAITSHGRQNSIRLLK